MVVTFADLKLALDEQNKKIDERIKASRLTNALLLGQALRLDPTVPESAQKIKRNLSLVETLLASDSDD